MRFVRAHALAVAAVALAIAGVGAGVAYAATSGQTPQQRHDAYIASVAKHAGVSVDALKAAMKTAGIEQVDAALAAGEITKAQADAAKARIESGVVGPLGGFGFGGHMGMGPGMGHDGGFVVAAADYLGLTQVELRTQLAAGKSLADIAKAKGKTVDGLKQAIVKAETTELDAAVKAGTITSDQEKQILAQLELRIDDMVNGTAPARGAFGDRGGMRGHGGMGGFGGMGGSGMSGGSPAGAGFSLS